MIQDSRMRFWLLLGAGFTALLYFLAPVLTPFLFSALLAYLGDPLVDRMEVHGFTRTFSVITVFWLLITVMLLVMLILVPLLLQQATTLIQQFPAFIEWLNTSLAPWLSSHLGIDPSYLQLDSLRQQALQSFSKVGSLAVQVMSTITHSSAVFIGWMANLLLIPVLVFYLLRDWDILVAKVRDLLPRRIEPTVSLLASQADEILGSFIRGQFLVMLALGIIYVLGLTMIGLQFALLIGMLAGLVSFVPYLGFIVGICAASIAALVQFQELGPLLQVGLVFTIGQMLEGMLLTPILVGDRIGLHPVAVIFALMAGGYLFGFFGVLLGLPAAAVLMVLLRYAHARYLESHYYQDVDVD